MVILTPHCPCSGQGCFPPKRDLSSHQRGVREQRKTWPEPLGEGSDWEQKYFQVRQLLLFTHEGYNFQPTSMLECVVIYSLTVLDALAAFNCRRTCQNCTDGTSGCGESLFSEDPGLWGLVVLVNGVEIFRIGSLSTHQQKSVLILHRGHHFHFLWQTWSLPPLSSCSVVNLSVSHAFPNHQIVPSSHNNVISVRGEISGRKVFVSSIVYFLHQLSTFFADFYHSLL